MANTNFKVFNEEMNTDRTFSDSEYAVATQRQTGVIPGMALSRLHNKMYRQSSAMAKAVADFLVAQGYDCMDSDIPGITAGIQAAILKAAQDKADTAKEAAIQYADKQLAGKLGKDEKAASAISADIIIPLQNYSKKFSDLPKTYPDGISSVFVKTEDGWPNYGSILTVKSYAGGGSTYQIYTPYSPNCGGIRNKVRFGNYDVNNGDSWTEFADLALLSDIHTSLAEFGLGSSAQVTDFHTINATGFYFGYKALHSPPASNTELIFVFANCKNGAVSLIAQSYHPSDAGKIWSCSKYGDAWSEWKEPDAKTLNGKSDTDFQPIEETSFNFTNEEYVAVRTPKRKANQYYEFWDTAAGWADIHCGNVILKNEKQVATTDGTVANANKLNVENSNEANIANNFNNEDGVLYVNYRGCKKPVKQILFRQGMETPDFADGLFADLYANGELVATIKGTVANALKLNNKSDNDFVPVFQTSRICFYGSSARSSAQGLNMLSLLCSDTYSDESKVPEYGGWLKGKLYIENGKQVATVDQIPKLYVSPFTAFAADTTPFVFTHGLGDIPRRVELQIVCQTAEFGYSAGDVLFNPQENAGGYSANPAVWANSTQCGFTQYGGYKNALMIPDKAVGSTQYADITKWKFRLIAEL